MFGISWAELLVILLVAVVVIPARLWPDVARMLARMINFVRSFVWKITDASEQIKKQIDLEKPIDDLIHTTTEDVLSDFSSPLPRNVKKKKTAAAASRNTKKKVGTKCKK